jgi:hypothetical protein
LSTNETAFRTSQTNTKKAVETNRSKRTSNETVTKTPEKGDRKEDKNSAKSKGMKAVPEPSKSNSPNNKSSNKNQNSSVVPARVGDKDKTSIEAKKEEVKATKKVESNKDITKSDKTKEPEPIPKTETSKPKEFPVENGKLHLDSITDFV